MKTQTKVQHWVACRDCDLLQVVEPLAPGESARCARCNALLDVRTGGGIDCALALTVAALITLAVANIYPILSIRLQSFTGQATLLDMVRIMYAQDMALVGALVLITALIAPALMLGGMFYLLLPLRLGYIPFCFSWCYRMVRHSSPWVMTEVLILGVVVSFVKLNAMVSVQVGIAAWAFAATMVLLAAIASSINTQALWHYYEKYSGKDSRHEYVSV